MRYRPFGVEGRSISALTLALDDEPKRPSERTRLVYAALEAGVNAFELRGRDMIERAEGLGAALSVVPRDAVLISLRLSADARHGYRPFTREWVIHAIERTVASAGLDRLDLLTLDVPASGALDAEAKSACEAAQDAGRIGMIGVAGDPQALDEAMRWRRLGLMVSPYHLRSGWPDRNRMKQAASRGIIVVGSDSYPTFATQEGGGATPPVGKRGLFGMGRKAAPLEKMDGYAFLQRTHGWTSAELCLAYALTEPSLASVIVETTDAKVLAGLAEVPERDIPTGVPALIEMARFTAA